MSVCPSGLAVADIMCSLKLGLNTILVTHQVHVVLPASLAVVWNDCFHLICRMLFREISADDSCLESYQQ